MTPQHVRVDWCGCLGFVSNETQTKTYQKKQGSRRRRRDGRSSARCSAPCASSSVCSTRANQLHCDAAAPWPAALACRLQCQIRRGLDDSGSRTATSAAPIVDQERSRGTRRPANWRVLLAGALPVVIGKTAGVPGPHAERLWWVRAGVESAAGRGFEMAHKRVQVFDVGRLVRPSEADPDYLSYDRP